MIYAMQSAEMFGETIKGSATTTSFATVKVRNLDTTLTLYRHPILVHYSVDTV